MKGGSWGRVMGHDAGGLAATRSRVAIGALVGAGCGDAVGVAVGVRAGVGVLVGGAGGAAIARGVAVSVATGAPPAWPGAGLPVGAPHAVSARARATTCGRHRQRRIATFCRECRLCEHLHRRLPRGSRDEGLTRRWRVAMMGISQSLALAQVK